MVKSSSLEYFLHKWKPYSEGELYASDIVFTLFSGYFSKHWSQDHAVHWRPSHPRTWHGGWR